MAARIAKLLDTSADSWLRMQAVLDLWGIQQDPKKLAGIKPIKQTRSTQSHREKRIYRRGFSRGGLCMHTWAFCLIAVSAVSEKS